MQFNKVNIPKLARNKYDYVAQGSVGGTTIISGGSGGTDSVSRLIEPIYSDDGEICGIHALYSMSVQGGVNIYTGGEGTNSPSIYDGLPIDNITLYWDNGVLKSKGSAGMDEGKLKTYLDSNAYINNGNKSNYLPAWVLAANKPAYTWNEISNKPSWIGADKPGYSWAEIGSKPSWIGDNKPTYAFSEIGGKPTTLGGYGITDAVTLATDQTINGAKTFGKQVGFSNNNSALYPHIYGNGSYLFLSGKNDINNSIVFDGNNKLYPYKNGSIDCGSSVNRWATLWSAKGDFSDTVTIKGGVLDYDNTTKVWKITGNLLVTGGITQYGDILTGSAILDALPVDATLSKANGVLSVVGGGFLSSITVKLGTVAYDSANGIVSLPAYPTTLPASDVPAWAKASSKPGYTIGEITGLQGVLDGKALASHAHNYAGTVKIGTTAYNVVSNVISLPEYPTALKSPNALTISLNGTSQGAYDGSAAKSFNINYSNVGAPSTTGSDASGTWGINITGDANTLDGYHQTAFNMGWTSSTKYRIERWGGSQDLTWKKIVTYVCTGGGTYQACKVKGTIYFIAGNHYQSLVTDIPFEAIMYAYGGVSNTMLNQSSLYLPSYCIWDLIRIVRYANNSWELQVRQPRDWTNISLEYTVMAGGGTVTAGQFITTTNSTTVVNAYNSGATKPDSDRSYLAERLLTARSINGTNFDGTSNITTALWGTARSFSIVSSNGSNASSAVSVNGSGNVSLYLPSTITASLSGNASTATALQTARTLWGQSFRGDGNVSGTLSSVADISMSGNLKFSAGGYHVIQNSSGQQVLCSNNQNTYIGSPAMSTTQLEAGSAWLNVSNGRVNSNGYFQTNSVYAPAYSHDIFLNSANATFGVTTNGVVAVDSCRNIISWIDTISGQGYITRYTIGSFRKNSTWGQLILSVGNNDSGTSVGASLVVSGTGVVTIEGNLVVTGGITQYSNGISTTDTFTSNILRANDCLLVGAGTRKDAPERYICCYGKTGSSYINLGYSGSAANTAEISFNYFGSGSGSNEVGIGFYGGASYGKLIIRANKNNSLEGSLTTTGTVTPGSDMRRKNIVRFTELTVDQVANAPLFDYYWKDLNDGAHTGTSAQYWQNVLPNTVRDNGASGLALDYNGVNIAGLITVSREIVKLKRENEELRQEINKLKERAS